MSNDADDGQVIFMYGKYEDMGPISEPETVPVQKEVLDDLLERSEWLRALEEAGVDNWEGISLAHDIYETFYA